MNSNNSLAVGTTLENSNGHRLTVSDAGEYYVVLSDGRADGTRRLARAEAEVKYLLSGEWTIVEDSEDSDTQRPRTRRSRRGRSHTRQMLGSPFEENPDAVMEGRGPRGW